MRVQTGAHLIHSFFRLLIHQYRQKQLNSIPMATSVDWHIGRFKMNPGEPPLAVDL